MRTVFVDTFFFLALLNANDVAHEKAKAANRANYQFVTSYWVLLELADHLCDERNRTLLGDVLDAITVDGHWEIISARQDTLEEAIRMYRDRSDKSWSLTDCTSFVLMQERGISEALTGDHHFEQASFKALLR